MANVSSPERVVLEGVDRYRVTEPLFEGLRVILSFLGEPYSPAYIQGISGASFRVAGICPCAPTCSAQMSPSDLLTLLGYDCATLPLHGERIDPARDVEGLVDHVKRSICAGRPALVWHAFTFAEWDVVCGYDDGLGQFLGRGSYQGLEAYATADQRRTATCLDICPALGAILVGERLSALDARSAELAALREAVRHAHASPPAPPSDSGWVMLEGLACYARWAGDLRAQPARAPAAGDRYCLGVYRSTHAAAAAFLEEIALHHPPATERLMTAAAAFRSEAEVLDACCETLYPGHGPQTLEDAERNARAADLVDRARQAYARGIDAIAQSLQALDAD